MGYLVNYVVKVPQNLVKNAQYVLLYENEIHISVSFHIRYGPNTLTAFTNPLAFRVIHFILLTTIY